MILDLGPLSQTELRRLFLTLKDWKEEVCPGHRRKLETEINTLVAKRFDFGNT